MNNLEKIKPQKLIYQLENEQYKCQIGLSVLGVNIGFRTDLEINITNLTRLLPTNAVFIKFEDAEEIFSLLMEDKASVKGFFWNNELISGATNIREFDLERIEHKIQYVLSIILPPEKFIFHAGAVSYKDVGIIFPGKSRAGKSTLTKEFLKVGAKFYTDDCSVIDKEGNLYAYPTALKIRDKNGDQQLFPVECFGAEIGMKPVLVKYVVFCNFEMGGGWKPTNISQGDASFLLLENLFYRSSIHKFPKETLAFLHYLTDNAAVLKGVRGEAKYLVEDIVSRIDAEI